MQLSLHHEYNTIHADISHLPLCTKTSVSSKRYDIIQPFLASLKLHLQQLSKGFSKNSAVSYANTRCDDLLNLNDKVNFQNDIPSAVPERCNSLASFFVNRLLHTGHFLLHTGCLKQQSCLAHICKIFQQMDQCQPLMWLKYPVTVQAL